MKNKKISVLIIVLSILFSISFQSCGSRTPIIDGSKPFVVRSIEKISETHCMYVAINAGSGHFGNPLETNAAIVLPIGMYQVNDTISVSGFNKPNKNGQ
jgi:hypothetical protein